MIPDHIFELLLTGRTVEGLDVLGWDEQRRLLLLCTPRNGQRKIVVPERFVGPLGDRHRLEVDHDELTASPDELADRWKGDVFIVRDLERSGVYTDPLDVINETMGTARWYLDDAGEVIGRFAWDRRTAQSFAADCVEHVLLLEAGLSEGVVATAHEFIALCRAPDSSGVSAFNERYGARCSGITFDGSDEPMMNGIGWITLDWNRQISWIPGTLLPIARGDGDEAGVQRHADEKAWQQERFVQYASRGTQPAPVAS